MAFRIFSAGRSAGAQKTSGLYHCFQYFCVIQGKQWDIIFCKKVASEIAATKPKVAILHLFSHEPIQTQTVEDTSTKVAEWSESLGQYKIHCYLCASVLN